MTAAELAGKIDHTLLTPETTPAEVERLVAEGAEHGFASVCVAPAHVVTATRAAAGRVKVCGVVGFPHGNSRATVKAIEATAAAKDGAAEIDMVAFLPNLLAQDVAATLAEVREVVAAVRAVRPDIVVKVIVESAVLMRQDGEARISAACEAVRRGGADFIKTSTGFHPAGGASADAVRLMRRHAGGLRVKASGGIRDLATAQKMLAAGADRLGMSAGVQVLAELAGAAPDDRPASY